MSIFDLAWLIPIFPLLAFVAISVFTHHNRVLSHWLAIGGITISLVLSQFVFWAAVLLPVGRGEQAFESALIPWLPIGLEVFSLGVYIDPASAVMLFMAPLVCLMIFIYSVGYMRGDPRYSHFFAYISLCATGILGLVVLNNLLAFFIFWEITSACSYLLVGFWHEKKSAMQAGLKTFLVTRVSDLFFMLGLVLLYSEVDSLAYRDVFSQETLHYLAHTPFLGTRFSLATVIALLIFGGTVGKSAQFPLHVWLPDAAKGPIPALALIHTATTVSAGAFLMVRAFPLFAAAEASLQIPGLQITVVAFTGALTAILFSAIAIVQNDIRRVLAFSTISQLGFVVAALGIGDYAAGAFHLITHAFSKALLCLGSGSVIHGMEHGQAPHVAMEEVTANPREEFDPNNLAKMGGLARRQPVTYWTFVAGTLSLSGFPLLTVGFWSQERVLNAAYEIYHPLVFWMLAVAAILTAFYAARLLCLTFLGQPRSEAAANAQESERNMTIPLVVLAVLAACPGWGGALLDWFYRFAGNGQAAGAASFAWQPLAISAGFALGGLLAGYLAYGRRSLRAGQMDPVEAVMCWMWLGWLYDAMRDRSYLDELYQWIFVQGSILIADVSAWLDSTIVDGAVKGAWWVGQNLSRTSARIEAAMTELVNLAGSAGRATSRASAWLEANVVDASVSLAGRAGMKLSEISGLLDLQVVDRLVSLAGPCTRAISDLSDRFDRKVVDGVVNGVASVVKAGGWAIQRRAQTGSIQYYLLLAAVGVLVLVGCFVFLFLPDYLLEPISLGLLALVVILVIYFMIQFRNKESGTR